MEILKVLIGQNTHAKISNIKYLFFFIYHYSKSGHSGLKKEELSIVTQSLITVKFHKKYFLYRFLRVTKEKRLVLQPAVCLVNIFFACALQHVSKHVILF